MLETGNWKLETGSWILDAGCEVPAGTTVEEKKWPSDQTTARLPD
jgi:hypothetical protein